MEESGGGKLFEKFTLQEAYGLLIDPELTKPEYVRDIQQMELQDDDIFVVAYPKCGITWTEYIIWEILNRGAKPPSFREMNRNIFPFLEITGVEVAKHLPRPRTLKLHSPHHLTPKYPKAKYIVVMRNPFDCCVSYFHHMKQRYYVALGKVMTFDRFFECFIEGQVVFGDYFDFILSWYDRRNDPNVLFLFFEQMKTDPEGSILKIAEFLGSNHAQDIRENKELLAKILHHSSFSYMRKNLELDQFITIDPLKAGRINGETPRKVEFFRKGEIGDWRRLFSKEQEKRLMDKLEHKLKDLDLTYLLRPPPACM